jgi:hypothetical protein
MTAYALGISHDPRENSSEAKDLVITNAVECSFSLFSQTIADQTKVDENFLAKNDDKIM